MKRKKSENQKSLDAAQSSSKKTCIDSKEENTQPSYKSLIQDAEREREFSIKSGDYTKPIDFLLRSLELQPTNNAETLTKLLYLYDSIGCYKDLLTYGKSELLLRHGLSNKPDILYIIGGACIFEGEFNLAVEYFNKVSLLVKNNQDKKFFNYLCQLALVEIKNIKSPGSFVHNDIASILRNLYNLVNNPSPLVNQNILQIYKRIIISELILGPKFIILSKQILDALLQKEPFNIANIYLKLISKITYHYTDPSVIRSISQQALGHIKSIRPTNATIIEKIIELYLPTSPHSGFFMLTPQERLAICLQYLQLLPEFRHKDKYNEVFQALYNDSFSNQSIDLELLIKITDCIIEVNRDNQENIIEPYVLKTISSLLPCFIDKAFSLVEKLSLNHKIKYFESIDKYCNTAINTLLSTQNYKEAILLANKYLTIFKNFPEKEVVITINNLFTRVATECYDPNILNDLLALNDSLTVWHKKYRHNNKILLLENLGQKILICCKAYCFNLAIELNKLNTTVYYDLFLDKDRSLENTVLDSYIYTIKNSLQNALKHAISTKQFEILKNSSIDQLDPKDLSNDTFLLISEYYLVLGNLDIAALYLNKAIKEGQDKISILLESNGDDMQTSILLNDFFTHIVSSYGYSKANELCKRIEERAQKDILIKHISSFAQEHLNELINLGDYINANRLYDEFSITHKIEDKLLIALLQLNIERGEYKKAEQFFDQLLSRPLNSDMVALIKAVINDLINSYNPGVDPIAEQTILAIVNKAKNNINIEYNPRNLLDKVIRQLIETPKTQKQNLISLRLIINEINPSDIANIKQLYILYMLVNEYPKANIYIDKLLTANPERHSYLTYKIHLCFLLKDYNYIRDNGERIFHKVSNNSNIKYKLKVMDTLYQAYLDMYFSTPPKFELSIEQKEIYAQKIWEYLEELLVLNPYNAQYWLAKANLLKLVKNLQSFKDKQSLIVQCEYIANGIQIVDNIVSNLEKPDLFWQHFEKLQNHLVNTKDTFAKQEVAKCLYTKSPNNYDIFKFYLNTLANNRSDPESLEYIRQACITELKKPLEGTEYNIDIYNLAKAEFCRITRRQVITDHPRSLLVLATIKVIENFNIAPCLPYIDNSYIIRVLEILAKDVKVFNPSIVHRRELYALWSTAWVDKTQTPSIQHNQTL